MYNILIFAEIRSYLIISLEEHLKGLGYNIINVDASVNDLNDVKEEINAVLIYADEALMKKQQALVFLRDKVVQNDVSTFIIGDVNEMAVLRDLFPRQLVKKEFPRPIDVKDVAVEVDEFIKLYGNQTKKKILVVDDSGAMLRSVKEWLEDYYQVILANSGTMAIKYLSTNRPDLVLLDYEMPVINGKQVLEMIRSESDFSDIPVMFLTGKNDKETIQELLALRPEGYILKTTKPEQIIQMIHEFFEKQKTI